MLEAPQVLYEDNHLLIVNKPADLLTQPSGTELPNLEALCKIWLKEKYQKKGNVFLEAVHRLDKPVSGIVVFAKTSKALSRLNESIRQKEMHKIYQAWVEPAPKKEEESLENYLIHEDHQASISSKDNPLAKLAKLHYRVLKREGDRALLEIDLKTGRYHQIRVQLSAAGYPIIGDFKYGSLVSWIPQQIALRHVNLKLIHPITKLKLKISID